MASDFHTHFVHPGKMELVNGGKGNAPLWSLPFHPWETSKIPENTEPDFQECTAVGELGFDRYRGALAYPEEQLSLLRQLLRKAADYGKPVVLHAVGGADHLFVCKKEFKELRFLVHGFSKHNPRLLKQLLDNGFYVSLHPALTGDEELRAFLKSCPGCRVGLETDDRNDLAIEELYEKINIPDFEKAADLHFREFLQL